MKCPNPECDSNKNGEELPDDYAGSWCDVCGIDLFRCVDSTCSAFGVLTSNAKHCIKCGEPVEPNGPAAGQAPAQEEQIQSTSTEFMQAPGGSRLFFTHADGWTMELFNDDILGRVYGRHVDKLGSTKVLSGTHAKITRTQDGWYIADQKSLNKTWVNGKEAEPYIPIQIKQNDVVTLASLKFTVTEI